MTVPNANVNIIFDRSSDRGMERFGLVITLNH